jgi:hypothetical protein
MSHRIAEAHAKPVRKTRARRRVARLDLVDWRDAVDKHCWRLDTLAALLTACDRPLAPMVAEGVGYSVSQEVAAVRTWLDKLGKEAR